MGAANRPAKPRLDFLTRINREGEPIATGSLKSSPMTFTSGQTIIQSTTLNPTKALWVDSITLWSNKNCHVRVLSQPGLLVTGAGSPEQLDIKTGLAAYHTAPIPVKKLLFGSLDGGLAHYVTDVYDDDKTGCVFSISLNGVQFTDDPAIAAEKVVLVVGDSIVNGTGITTATEKANNFYPWQIRNYFRNTLGIDCRLVIMAESGSTSVSIETWRKLGKYDLPDIAGIFYVPFVNDAASGTSAATAKSNCENWIDWKQKHHPKAPLIMLGATPRSDSYETTLIDLRAAMAEAVTEADDPKVYYKSLASTIDRTGGTSTYVTGESPGIHPNAASHLLIGQDIVQFLVDEGIRI